MNERILTDFETRKNDLVCLGIPSNGIARIYFPEVNSRQRWAARLEVSPEMRVNGKVALL